jgi:hypothetical protein
VRLSAKLLIMDDCSASRDAGQVATRSHNDWAFTGAPRIRRLRCNVVSGGAHIDKVTLRRW